MGTHVQRQCKVSVEADEQYKQGGDEVVNRRRARRSRKQNVRDNGQDGGEAARDVAAQHHSARVFERQLGSDAVNSVLVDSVGHCVEKKGETIRMMVCGKIAKV